MIYSIMGYGKGKTESAIGCSVRAIQNGDDVLFVQFLKDGHSSEISFFEEYKSVYILTGNTSKITLPKNITDKDKEEADRLFKEMCKYISYHKPKLVVADEILPALDMGLLPIEQMNYLIAKCSETNSDLYMTGRVRNKANRVWVAENSDICTDAHCVRHSFNTHCLKCGKDYPYYYTYCPQCREELVKSKQSKLGRDY